jgi:hypothetical protein
MASHIGTADSPAIRRCGHYSTRPSAATRSSSRSIRSNGTGRLACPRRSPTGWTRSPSTRACSRSSGPPTLSAVSSVRACSKATNTGRSGCIASAARASSNRSTPRASRTSRGRSSSNCTTSGATTRRRGSRRISIRSGSKARSTSTRPCGDALASFGRPEGMRRGPPGAGVRFCVRGGVFSGLGFFFCNGGVFARNRGLR